MNFCLNLFGVFGVWHKKYYFSQENAKMGCPQTPIFGQKLSQKNYLIICFFPLLPSCNFWLGYGISAPNSAPNSGQVWQIKQEKKKQIIFWGRKLFIFCLLKLSLSDLTAFLHYKISLKWISDQIWGPEIPSWMAENCLNKKLLNYLPFWVFGGSGTKNTIFPKKLPNWGVQKPLLLGKNYLRKELFNYLFLSPVAFLQSLTLLWDFGPLFSCFVPFSSFISSSFQTFSGLKRVCKGLNTKCRTWMELGKGEPTGLKGLKGLKRLERSERFEKVCSPLSHLQAWHLLSKPFQTFSNRNQSFSNLFKPFWGAAGGWVAQEILGQLLNPFQTFQTCWVSENLQGQPRRGPQKRFDKVWRGFKLAGGMLKGMRLLKGWEMFVYS